MRPWTRWEETKNIKKILATVDASPEPIRVGELADRITRQSKRFSAACRLVEDLVRDGVLADAGKALGGERRVVRKVAQ